MAQRQRRRPNATGRNDATEQYANVPYRLWQSEAFRSLSGPAAKIWPELRSRFHGGNNGRLTLSLEEAARLLHMGNATAMRAFAERNYDLIIGIGKHSGV